MCSVNEMVELEKSVCVCVCRVCTFWKCFIKFIINADRRAQTDPTILMARRKIFLSPVALLRLWFEQIRAWSAYKFVCFHFNHNNNRCPLLKLWTSSSRHAHVSRSFLFLFFDFFLKINWLHAHIDGILPFHQTSRAWPTAARCSSSNTSHQSTV